MLTFDFDLSKPNCKLVRHGYRQMLATNRFLDLTYESGDSIHQLRQELAARTAGGPDNHECYELLQLDKGKLVLQFSDWHLYIGTECRPWGY